MFSYEISFSYKYFMEYYEWKGSGHSPGSMQASKYFKSLTIFDKGLTTNNKSWRYAMLIVLQTLFTNNKSQFIKENNMAIDCYEQNSWRQIMK